MKKFLKRLWKALRLPDLSSNYADPAIAAKQRELVDQQLQAMRDGRAPAHFAVVGRILGELREQSGLESISVLDAGCGSGYYSEIVEHFAPGWVRYTGADFNPGMLAMARQHYPNLPLARMDLRRLAMRDQAFDLVMSGAVIVHIKEWDQAARDLARLARRWLLLHRTMVYIDNEPTSVTIEQHYDTEVYRVRIREQDLLKLISDAGLKLVSKCDAGEVQPGGTQQDNTYLFERP